MKQLSLWISGLLLLAMPMLSCNNPAGTSAAKTGDSTIDLGKVKAMMQSSNDALGVSFKSKDSVAITANYTSDAMMLPPNTTAVSGTDQIRGTWHYFMGLDVKDLKLTTSDVWGDNNLVTEQGTWSLTNTKDAVIDHGKFLVLWKQEGGKWKMFRDIWNSDMPLPVPAKK
jgi:ketosteroid isomerase-like protein